jgi:small conductance mechanosensitive channel
MTGNILGGILTEVSTETFPEVDVKEAAEELINNVSENPDYIKEYMQEKLPGIISFALQVGIALLIFWIGTKIIRGIVKLIHKSMERHDMETGTMSFLCTIIRYALDFVLIMFILSGFGLSGSIIALLGSAGLTVGLALQGSLSNFAGGVLIIMLKPFVVGDYIVDSSSGKEGTVRDITIFYTQILTIDNKMVNIPNGELSNATITNVSRMENRRLDLTVGVAYSSNLSKVKTVMMNVILTDDAVLKEEPIDVFVDSLGDSSITMGMHVWVKNADYWTTRWRMLERIKTTFDQEGVSIPFPQLDVNMKK